MEKTSSFMIVVCNGKAKVTDLPIYGETKIIIHQGKVKRVSGRGGGFLNLPDINWDAISAIASAIATLAALTAIILTIRNNKDSEREKQFFVQAWFHVTRIERMGPLRTIDLIILNDAVSTIRMDKAFLIVDEKKTELNFKYVKKDDQFKEIGKTFVVQIKNNDDLIGKNAVIEIVYTNLYNNQMKAISPIFYFIEKRDVYTRVDIKNEKFLYIPFKNELI